jgi:hypothetical protein
MATVARRHQALTAEIAQLNTALKMLLDHAAPAGFLARTGVGTRSAASLLITAGDNPGRLRTEASFAALCGVMPGGPRLAADVAISPATQVDLHRFFTVPASGLHARGIGLSCGQAAGWISHVRAAA